jgi:hypothetical protein
MRQNERMSIWLTILGLLAGLAAEGQVTGGHTKLDFLTLPSQAHNNAVGTTHFSGPGHDPALFFQSPTAIDSSKANNVSLNIMPYLADTRFINMAYGQALKKTDGSWALGIQYLNYGTMIETDAVGNVIGEFRAADYAIAGGYGHSLGAFHLGVSAKLVGSHVDAYQTYGMAVDWGASFKHPKQDLTVAFVVKNVGFLRQNYTSAVAPILPLDVRAGITLKPEYMPVRFSVTAHHLNRFDMVYNDPDLFYTFDFSGNKLPKKVSVPEKLGRHLALGIEALIHPKFRILAGYDHLRRQELRLADKGALAGFSFGVWLNVKRFEITYGRSQYMPGIGTNSLSILMKIRKNNTK